MYIKCIFVKSFSKIPSQVVFYYYVKVAVYKKTSKTIRSSFLFPLSLPLALTPSASLRYAVAFLEESQKQERERERERELRNRSSGMSVLSTTSDMAERGG
jgi:hypothetical protein